MSNAATKHHPNYIAVFWVLLIFTLLEVGIAYLRIAKLPMALILISLAMTKALLVAMFYMHLKFEKRLLILIAVSPFIFAVILTLALMPDIGIGR
ncbi:MAG: cytochrome C oxidase subunit IV family protein [Candidatus Omnitrophica bacterium]|nr:cytochrome C oxidase subunit IV family protein [Candidatus Omnitrophota bacterium]